MRYKSYCLWSLHSLISHTMRTDMVDKSYVLSNKKGQLWSLNENHFHSSSTRERDSEKLRLLTRLMGERGQIDVNSLRRPQCPILFDTAGEDLQKFLIVCNLCNSKTEVAAISRDCVFLCRISNSVSPIDKKSKSCSTFTRHSVARERKIFWGKARQFNEIITRSFSIAYKNETHVHSAFEECIKKAEVRIQRVFFFSYEIVQRKRRKNARNDSDSAEKCSNMLYYLWTRSSLFSKAFWYAFLHGIHPTAAAVQHEERKKRLARPNALWEAWEKEIFKHFIGYFFSSFILSILFRWLSCTECIYQKWISHFFSLSPSSPKWM